MQTQTQTNHLEIYLDRYTACIGVVGAVFSMPRKSGEVVPGEMLPSRSLTSMPSPVGQVCLSTQLQCQATQTMGHGDTLTVQQREP